MRRSRIHAVRLKDFTLHWEGKVHLTVGSLLPVGKRGKHSLLSPPGCGAGVSTQPGHSFLLSPGLAQDVFPLAPSESHTKPPGTVGEGRQSRGDGCGFQRSWTASWRRRIDLNIKHGSHGGVCTCNRPALPHAGSLELPQGLQPWLVSGGAVLSIGSIPAHPLRCRSLQTKAAPW